VNPSGRLPLTFYADDAQLRPKNEYDITKGRTYMYLNGKPAYPFGHGLSYTTFAYANPKLSKTTLQAGEKVTVSVDVSNTGSRDGDEVVQCYVHAPNGGVPMAIRQLWGFQRVTVPKGGAKSVSITLDSSNFGHWDTASKTFKITPGLYEVQIGASSSDIRSTLPLTITARNTP